MKLDVPIFDSFTKFMILFVSFIVTASSLTRLGLLKYTGNDTYNFIKIFA